MPSPVPPSIAAVVLAAGASTRMGQPKQLMQYRGQTLLRRAAEAALAVGCAPVVVVLGSAAESLRDQLKGLAVSVAVNPEWPTGMGSSVRVGIAAVTAQTTHCEPDAILITLADQALVDAAALQQLIGAFSTKASPIAAAAYGGSIGVPAVFGRECFSHLATLAGSGGAKTLLRQRADQVLAVPMEAAATDIDTPGDYERLDQNGL